MFWYNLKNLKKKLRNLKIISVLKNCTFREIRKAFTRFKYFLIKISAYYDLVKKKSPKV